MRLYAWTIITAEKAIFTITMDAGLSSNMAGRPKFTEVSKLFIILCNGSIGIPVPAP